MSEKIVLWAGILIILILSAQGCKSVMGPIKADLLMDVNKYDQALLIYKDHLSKYPATADVLGKAGFAYMKLGQLGLAEEQFKKALVLDPSHIDSTLYLGLIYLRQKEYRAARETWQNYRNEAAPLLEEEMRRLTTMARLAEARHFAKKALAEENKIQTRSLAPNSIAVSHFHNLSNSEELNGFSKGLAAMVISELSKIKSLQVIERLSLQALMSEMALGQSGLVDNTRAPRVGRLLGVENVVVGGLAEGLEVNSVLAKVKSSTAVETTSLVIEPENFFELPGKIASDVAVGLGMTLSPGQLFAISQPQTVSYKAVVFYGKGLQAFDVGKWGRAKHLFGLALEEDHNFLLAQEAFASCPGANYPIILSGSDSEVARENLAAFAEEAIGHSMGAQGDADDEAESSSGGGGGGD